MTKSGMQEVVVAMVTAGCYITYSLALDKRWPDNHFLFFHKKSYVVGTH